jgi:hypothetical protein
MGATVSFNNLPETIFDTTGRTLAIIIPGSYGSTDIEFLTEPSSNFQVGLMHRGPNSPAYPHAHKQVSRQICGTQEFLLVRKGSMTVTIYDEKEAVCAIRELQQTDSILLLAGGHGIAFREKTEILEVKQGPYVEGDDKFLINLGSYE